MSKSEELKTLFIDINPHDTNKVIHPKDLDKPNILERAAYDKAFILNSNTKQLYNKALFNVLRALKKGCKCEITMETNDDAIKVGEEGKIAGFITAEISGSKVILTK